MAYITIPTKEIEDSLTSSEFNQLLEALKNGTRSLKTLNIEGTNITFTGEANFPGNVSIAGETGPFSKYYELDRVIYVSSSGGVYDGVNYDGSSNGKAISTFQDAINNAETILGFTPTREDTIAIVCVDGATYEEDLTCIDYVDLYAPKAILKLGGAGEKQLNIKGNTVHFNKIFRDSGTNDMIFSTATVGDSTIKSNAIIDRGTGPTVHNTCTTSMYIQCLRFEVLGVNGIGITDYGGGSHHGHYHIASLLLGANNAIALQNTGAGYSIGYIDAISYEFLPVAGTKAFEVLDGRLSFNCNYIDAHIAYELAGDGILEVVTSRIIGARIESTGTAYVGSPADISEVDNTADIDKPISTATQNALDLKAALVHAHPYEPANANIQSHISSTANPHTVTKSQVGLSNVDNTSDIAKPISTATQNALDLKSNINHTHTSFTNINIGDVGGGNYAEFESDGTVKFNGTATVWEDIAGPVLGSSLNAANGTASYDWDNNAVVFSPNGNLALSRDRIAFVVQRPHKSKQNSLMKLHIHWEQTDAVNRTFNFRYRIQNVGAIKTTAWTTLTISTNANNTFAYSSGTLNQITSLVSIDMSANSLSSQIQVQLTRSDAVAGNIAVSFIDFHYEIDTVGSRQEFTK